MQQRDILLDQIEQLGRVLGRILDEFLRLKSAGKISQGIGVTNEQFKTKLDIDINTIINLHKNDLKNYLEDKKLTAQHVEILAQYLKAIGESTINSDKNKGKKYLEKAIVLFDISDELTATFSLDRMDKKREIEHILTYETNMQNTD